MAVGGARDVRVIEHLRLVTSYHLGDDHALALALVCEHRWASDIADGVNALHTRLHLLVDLHEAAIGELNALLLEADLVDVRRTPRSDEHDVRGEALLLTA